MTAPSRTLHIIGGAEDKEADREILKAFVEQAGGRDAKILVIPSASSIQDEVTEMYAAVFYDLGVDRVRSVKPRDRREADLDEVVELIDLASGIFMTGGNQAKLTTVMAGTRMADALHAAYQRGVPVAGTSAGASVMASHMVNMGSTGEMPRQRMAQLSAGIGLLADVIIDQHFSQRNRLGRLMTLVAQSPSHLGIGIDEDTALVVTDERHALVRGSGQVIIVDGRYIRTNAFEAGGHDPLLVSGAITHILPEGAEFDLAGRHLHRKDLDHRVIDATESYAAAVLAADTIRRADVDSADDRLLKRGAKRRAKLRG